MQERTTPIYAEWGLPDKVILNPDPQATFSMHLTSAMLYGKEPRCFLLQEDSIKSSNSPMPALQCHVLAGSTITI